MQIHTASVSTREMRVRFSAVALNSTAREAFAIAADTQGAQTVRTKLGHASTATRDTDTAVECAQHAQGTHTTLAGHHTRQHVP